MDSFVAFGFYENCINPDVQCENFEPNDVELDFACLLKLFENCMAGTGNETEELLERDIP
mgnify:CR=1 FL=1